MRAAEFLVVVVAIAIITCGCQYTTTYGFQPQLGVGGGGVSRRRPFSTTSSTLMEKKKKISSRGGTSPILRSTTRDDDGQDRPTNDDFSSSSKFDNINFDFNFGVNRRGFLTAATAAAAGAMLLSSSSEPANALTLTAASSTTIPLPWEASPVNKRSGVTVFDAEKSGGYNVAFITYLSRFLLNFDTNCQKYWFSNVGFPKGSTAKDIEQIRFEQFAAFSASVEVGLIDYEGTDGPKQLLQDLVRKYGTIPNTSSTTSSSADDESKRRLAKSARRHIALLFGLLEKTQPTSEITKLLASVDNGSVSKVKLSNETLLDGYELGNDEPQVTFNPPQAGDEYEIAEGKAILKPTGGLLRVDIVNGGGSNYKNPPDITVSSPSAEGGGTPAKLQAKISKGSIESIKIVDPGTGYTLDDDIQITITPPSDGGETAIAKPVLNMAIDRIEVTKGGSGYAVEKPLKVFVTQPSSKTTMAKATTKQKTSDEQQGILAGYAFPIAETTSFTTFRKDSDTQTIMEQEDTFESKYNLKEYEASLQVVRGSNVDGGTAATTTSNINSPLPFWAGRSSSSSQLLQLLPAGVGLEYDNTTKRYVLAMDTEFMKQYPAIVQLQQKGGTTSSNRIIGTEFGPRGRAPIERNMELDASTYFRFWLSGATCASLVHAVLTPLDVAKTRLQTAPDKYPNMGTAFTKIIQDDGPSTFFTGWLPTIVGNFLGGGALYVTTEFVRRSLSDAAGVDAVRLEVPIILAGAAVASTFGSIIYCPFEAVRIRTVAQPDFAPTSVDVFKKMLKEEGIGSLIDAIPIFLIKNIPYAMTKFLIFDLSTERMYDAFPAAQEDIKLSLLVSLIGGVLGGTAAACVSNPADAVISELKKAKSDISPQQAVANMLERNGISTFFVGLPLRILFYSLIASLTFVVYDFVRFLLRIGPDDLKLYLDVLGGSLGSPPSS